MKPDLATYYGAIVIVFLFLKPGLHPMGDSGSPYSKAELRERSNFRLEAVVKVNHLGISLFCLTFWAQRDENAERRLFRGVVWRGDVMLCEIKDGDDDISIPDGHVDDESRKYIRTEAYDRLWKWVQEMPDVCSEDESEDDSEDEKYDPGGRDGGVDVAGSAAGRIQNIPDVCSKDDSEDEKAVLQRGG
ncbi:uncharacterized protein [Henckelia pumila]|uniref:uncharacterized protein isoform X2 n=2 Tax=Henckelia pumila TaxID=405737 RepID=UPI003C6DD96E